MDLWNLKHSHRSELPSALAKDHGATVACRPSSSLRCTRLLLIDLKWKGNDSDNLPEWISFIILWSVLKENVYIVFGQCSKGLPIVQGFLLWSGFYQGFPKSCTMQAFDHQPSPQKCEAPQQHLLPQGKWAGPHRHCDMSTQTLLQKWPPWCAACSSEMPNLGISISQLQQASVWQAGMLKAGSPSMNWCKNGLFPEAPTLRTTCQRYASGQPNVSSICVSFHVPSMK